MRAQGVPGIGWNSRGFGADTGASPCANAAAGTDSGPGAAAGSSFCSTTGACATACIGTEATANPCVCAGTCACTETGRRTFAKTRPGGRPEAGDAGCSRQAGRNDAGDESRY